MTIASILGNDASGMVSGVPARVLQIQQRFVVRPSTTATSSATSAGFAQALSEANGTSAASGSGVTGDQVVDAAKKYLGVPYVWGGTDPKVGMDCSAFTQRAYKDMGIDIPRSSYAQANVGTPVASIADAKPGDLIMWDPLESTCRHASLSIL